MNSLEIDFHNTARADPTILALGVVKWGEDFLAFFLGDLAFDLGIYINIIKK
jgi:hypothetical protein